MIEFKKDKLVCTLYRVKKQNLKIEYPIVLDNKETLLIDDQDMMKIKVGPAGLMLIHRSIFETLIEKHPELKIKNDKMILTCMIFLIARLKMVIGMVKMFLFVIC
jgi:hypothetical protein